MAAFTQKHFIAVAQILNNQVMETEHVRSKDAGRVSNTRELAVAFADLFALENPRFDRHRFMVACGFLAIY